ncbi:MAG: hypothetical protein KAY37_10225 [Phycisphaerae bacterium]|nr:hypothetical protein [Phycisphaerae bacterium]
MAASQDQNHPVARPRARKPDWSRLSRLATVALERRLAAAREMSPLCAARTVAELLPPALGRALLRRLAKLGWLTPDAVIPFDILDGPDCPPEFRNGSRELARLAVFGLPGQGLASRDKHRQDVYQQFCAQIMSSAVDTVSLQSVAARALSHPDVNADPLLGSMMRSFIAEREAALRAARTTPEEEQQKKEHTSKLQRGFVTPTRCDFPSRGELQGTFSRLQREFDGYLAQFEVTRALRMLDKMREFRQRYPVYIAAADLQRCEEQYDRLLKRAGAYRRQIKDLSNKGAAAARAGNPETANWVIKRLQAIHTLLPTLLPEERLEALRAEISRRGQEHETEEAARELLDRKKEVAAKIKNLAGVVHRFHQLAARLSPADEAYRRAEANYRRAVEEIRGLDTEWLTGLVLQLETLLDDLDDPSGQRQNRLDQFIAQVRAALNRLCREIRAHQQAKQARPGNQRPPEGLSPARPA